MMFVFGYLLASGVLHTVLARTAMIVGVPEVGAKQETADIIYLPFHEQDERKAA